MSGSIPPPAGAPGTVRLLKAAQGPFQSDVWVVDADSAAPQVWKTWSRKGPLERALLGRRLARREGRIIAALQDLDGLPAFLGHPDDCTIAMSLLDAEPVPEVKQGGALSAAYFARLGAILSAMHDRGIVHGDLRRKNLLRAPGNPDAPRLVDFTQCLHVRVPAAGLRGAILRQGIRVDRVTFLKLKRWYLGADSLSPAELAEAEEVPWHLKLGRGFRKAVYRPIKRTLRGR